MGGGEKDSGFSVSWSSTVVKEEEWSQGGGEIFALRCFFRRSASQRGIEVLCGGWSVGIVPFEIIYN